MFYSLFQRFFKGAEGRSVAHRGVAFVVVLLFSFQLSRFFLIVPQGPHS